MNPLTFLSKKSIIYSVMFWFRIWQSNFLSYISQNKKFLEEKAEDSAAAAWEGAAADAGRKKTIKLKHYLLN